MGSFILKDMKVTKTKNGELLLLVYLETLDGGNLNLLQRQLWHRSFANTVNRYLTFSSEDVRGEYNRVLAKN